MRQQNIPYTFDMHGHMANRGHSISSCAHMC